jgi:hypothetical protein
MKPNDYDFYREFYIKTQIANVQQLLNNLTQEELEDGWQMDSKAYQLGAELEYWKRKLNT